MTTLLTIGGFLGAGKTTLIIRAATELMRRGRRVAVVTNDQAPELVDTQLVGMAGFPVAEVAGACFCCAFPDFAARTDELIARHRPDVVIAEPVGSCVDIAATVLRPFAGRNAGIAVAPFSVVVDPAAWRAAEAVAGMDAATAYIYRKQLAEADVLLLNKCDAEASAAIAAVEAELAAANPAARVLRVSAARGDGVADWLDAVLGGGAGGGRRIDVDYDTYAAGEAALGWLNASVEAEGAADWAGFLPGLLSRLAAAIAANGGGPPAHAKVMLRSGSLVLVANLVSGRSTAECREIVTGAPDGLARLTVNVRAPIDPAGLRAALTAVLAGLPGIAARVKTIRSFAPGRPVPVHRVG